MLVRAFIALNLPPEVKAGVEQFQGELKSSLRSELIRWTPPITRLSMKARIACVSGDENGAGPA